MHRHVYQRHLLSTSRSISRDASSPNSILPICSGGIDAANFQFESLTEGNTGSEAAVHALRYGSVIAGDEERVLSHSTKLIIAGTVFALGVFAGAAIAAWIVPPS